MAFGTAHNQRFGEAWAAITALVAEDGSARERFAATLTSQQATTRDLADAVHGLCLLHGRHPGVIDVAAGRAAEPVAVAWLADAVATFAEERATIVRLVAAAGPLPSTPGQAETEAAIAGQRHALDMLVASDRKGCAIGAALALMLDWSAVRTVLGTAATRFGIDIPAFEAPSREEGATVIAALADTEAFERAMLFGAQQLLAQHRALWQLLEARAAARHHA